MKNLLFLILNNYMLQFRNILFIHQTTRRSAYEISFARGCELIAPAMSCTTNKQIPRTATKTDMTPVNVALKFKEPTKTKRPYPPHYPMGSRPFG